jgi:hypothetical protein
VTSDRADGLGWNPAGGDTAESGDESDAGHLVSCVSEPDDGFDLTPGGVLAFS